MTHYVLRFDLDMIGSLQNQKYANPQKLHQSTFYLVVLCRALLQIQAIEHAAGMVRRTYKSSTAVSFTTSIPDPSSGEIKIQLSAAQTTAMKAGRYVYDLEITSSGGAVSRVVEGQLEVNPGVTYQER